MTEKFGTPLLGISLNPQLIISILMDSFKKKIAQSFLESLVPKCQALHIE